MIFFVLEPVSLKQKRLFNDLNEIIDSKSLKDVLCICTEFREKLFKCLKDYDERGEYLFVRIILKNLVSVVPTSVDVERLFSSFSNFIGKKNKVINGNFGKDGNGIEYY